MKKLTKIGGLLLMIILVLSVISLKNPGWTEDISDKISGFATITDSESNICVDSDGGKEYFIKGTVTYNSGDKELISDDYCFNTNIFYKKSLALREYICDNNNKKAGRTHFCDFDCDDGKCIAPPEIVEAEDVEMPALEPEEITEEESIEEGFWEKSILWLKNLFS